MGLQLSLVKNEEGQKPIYSIDSSVILEMWKGDRGMYPKEIHTGIWSHIDKLVQEGRIIMHNEVYKELKQHPNAEFQAWLKQNKDHMVINDKDSSQATKEIINGYYSKFKDGYVPYRKGGSAADPFIVGLAYARRAVVFTQEKPIASDQLLQSNEPHIPNVCNEYKIQWASINKFLRMEGITLAQA